jgi:acetylornithine deacetylase/succinyl-diaminopimelate desuccinylase family protein
MNLDLAEHAAAALLGDLVRARTENPPGHEVRVVEVLEAYLRAAGVHTWRGEVDADRPNLYATVGSGDPVLLLNGHTDTVPVGDGWTRPPLDGVIEDGRLYGRGAVDMKGGLAACAIAMAALAKGGDDLPGSVVFAAVMDEERGARGAKHAAGPDGLRARAAIVAEPTGMRVVPATNGQMNFAVRLHGLAAHSSQPERGYSALDDAWHLARRLNSTGKQYMIGTIAAGTAPNVIPAQCELQIDLRLGQGDTVDGAEAEFATILAAVTRAAPAPGEYEVTLSVPPFALAEDHPFTVAVAHAVGDAPPFRYQRGTTDAVWFAEAGIPTVICGPGDGRLSHMADEHVVIADVARGAQVFESLARTLLGVSSSSAAATQVGSVVR